LSADRHSPSTRHGESETTVDNRSSNNDNWGIDNKTQQASTALDSDSQHGPQGQLHIDKE